MTTQVAHFKTHQLVCVLYVVCVMVPLCRSLTRRDSGDFFWGVGWEGGNSLSRRTDIHNDLSAEVRLKSQ